jgi:hypothetical protein
MRESRSMEQKTALNSRPSYIEEAYYQKPFKVILYAYEQLEMDLEIPLHTPTGGAKSH